MAKNRKIKRNTKIYRRHRKKSKGFLFVLMILAAIALGFFGTKILKEAWDKAKQNQKPDTSDISSSSENESTSSSQSEGNSSDVTSSEPEPEETGFEAVVMPGETLLNQDGWQAFLTQAKENGKTAVVVELKDQNGVLYFKTSNALAAQYNAVSPQAVDAMVLSKSISDAGLVPMVRISTLKDPVVSRLAAGTTYHYQGGNENSWLDASLNQGGKTWLNPYQENARKYLSDLSSELAAAGFKTIILNDFYFPSDSSQSMGIAGETVSRADILKQLYREIADAVSAQGAEAIPEVPANAYFGVDEFRYGGSPAQLGLEQIVVDFTSGTIPISAEVLRDVDLNSPAAVMEALLGTIMTEGTTVIPYTDTAADYSAVLAAKKVQSFIAE